MIKHIDIAKKLDVSTATVSNALSGKGRMSEELRIQINQLAEQLGYKRKEKPLPMQHKKINILVEQMSTAVCHRTFVGVCKAARENKLILQVLDMGIVDYGRGISPPKDWLAEYVGGFLQTLDDSTSGTIYISQYPRDLTGVIPQKQYPIVFAGGYTSDGSYCVNYDDEQGAYLATSHLLNTGCTKPAMICGPIDSVSTSNRYIGFQRAIIDHGRSLDLDMIRSKDWEIEGGYSAMKDLLSMDEIPDGLFAHNDSMALGAIQAANEKGVRVPEDLKIVGMDNFISLYSSPSISTIETPLKKIGSTAVETLLQIREGNAPIDKSITFPCSLSLRESG